MVYELSHNYMDYNFPLKKSARLHCPQLRNCCSRTKRKNLWFPIKCAGWILLASMCWISMNQNRFQHQNRLSGGRWHHRLMLEQNAQRTACRAVSGMDLAADGISKIQFTKPGTDGRETYDFFVYKDGDIVSSDIMASGSYESNLMMELARAMERASGLLQVEKAQLEFWDIGANLGTHIVYLNSLGYHGIAFEPMPDNIRLLRSTLCSNDPNQERVGLITLGLSDKPAVCDVYVPPGNKGDGVVSCPVGDDPAQRKGISTEGYIPNGQIEVVRLDDLFFIPGQDDTLSDHTKTPHIGALKLDVEGFELKVVEGGRRFFTAAKIPFIAMEVWNLREDDLRELLAFFGSLGYQMSSEGFSQGMETLATECAMINLSKRYLTDPQYGWKDIYLYRDEGEGKLDAH